MRRVVVDPGVLVSAVITPAGPPAELIRAVRGGRLELIVSPHLLAELAGVLGRERFRRCLSPTEAEEYVEGLAFLAETVEDPEATDPVARDPSDDYLISLAGAARASALVSGDADLLSLDASPLPVLSPRDLLRELSEPS